MPRLSNDSNLPAAITNIRLCSALRDCGAHGVADTFDKSEENQLFVYDDRSLGYTDWATSIDPDFKSKCFHANNPNGSTIVLLPLDGRIITGAKVSEGGVCDGMLLTEQEMCFIEFKTDVTSSNDLTIKQRANEAIGQLWHTFNGIIQPKCAAKRKPVEKFLSINFQVVFDENLEITGVNSELMDLQVQFLVDNHYPLYFTNEKTFR